METLVLFFIPFFFVGFFAFVIFIISRFGWHKFTKHYGIEAEVRGESISYTSARIGWMNYNSVLRVIYNEDGLYLCPELFFKLFHQALFIPWKDIRLTGVSSVLFFEYADMTIGNPKIGEIKLHLKTFKQFKDYLKKKA